MRRVKARPPLPPEVKRAAGIAAGGIALAALMTVAAIEFAPSPRALAPLRHDVGQAIVNFTGLAGLRLEALTVEGRRMTAAEDILAALNISRGAPILTIDVAEARAALEALPWVKAAQVERRLPNAVHVVIEERQPYALWQRGSRYMLVDREGHEIAYVPEIDPAMRLIVGADAPQHAASLFTDLDSVPELAARVRTVVRVSERRWNVYLDTFEGGISVRLPETDLAAAWARLAKLERDSKILSRDLAFIDLRLPDRLIVRLRTNHPAVSNDKAADRTKTAPAAADRRTAGRTI